MFRKFKGRMFGGLVSKWLVITMLIVSLAGLVDAQVRRPSAAFQSLTVAGTALFADGTAAAPSIAFISQPTTGLIFGAGGVQTILGGNVSAYETSTTHRMSSNRMLQWSNTANVATGSADVSLERDGAGQLALKNSTVEQEFRTYLTTTGSLYTSLKGGSLTIGSGTGLTVNQYASLSRKTHKVTVTFAALSAGALTADKVIATLPAKTKLVAIYADTTIVYTGGDVSAATLIVGKTTGGNEYIVSHDVFTAVITKGLLDADLGTSINRANAIQGGDLPSWTGTTNISVRLTTVGANTDALTQGSTTYYLVTEALP